MVVTALSILISILIVTYNKFGLGFILHKIVELIIKLLFYNLLFISLEKISTKTKFNLSFAQKYTLVNFNF